MTFEFEFESRACEDSFELLAISSKASINSIDPLKNLSRRKNVANIHS